MSALRNLARRLFRTDAGGSTAEPAPQPQRALVRTDAYGPIGSGWVNSASGIGISGVDPSLASMFRRGWISDEQAIDMWQGDELITKLVSLLPSEAIEPGWSLTIQSDEQGADGTADPRDPVELAERVDTAHETLGTMAKVLRANELERLTGGAALWIGANDMTAGSWANPLDLTTGALRVQWLRVLRTRELYPHSYYEDPLNPKFGEVAVWRVQQMRQGTVMAGAAYVHESRIFIFSGKRVDDSGSTVTQNGWNTVFGDGILPGLYEAVRRFQMALQEVGLTLSANAEGVWTHENLADVLAAEGGEENFRTLVNAMNYAQSVLKARIIGGGQSFTRSGVPLSGVADIVDKFENQVAGIAGIPRTKLFGEAPGGLGNGDESGKRNWHKTLGTYRKHRQLPAYRWVTQHILVSLGGLPRKWSLDGNAYEEESNLEREQRLQIAASTDIALVQAQVITPDVVRKRQEWRDRYPLDDESELSALDLSMAPDDLRGEFPAEDPAASEAAPAAALSPAQLLALSAIVEKVSAGTMPRESGARLVMLGASLSLADALAMMPGEGFQPKAVDKSLQEAPTDASVETTQPTEDPIEDPARADCENPIRDEDGEFRGCAPGEGGGESSGGDKGEASGGKSSGVAAKPEVKAAIEKGHVRAIPTEARDAYVAKVQAAEEYEAKIRADMDEDAPRVLELANELDAINGYYSDDDASEFGDESGDIEDAFDAVTSEPSGERDHGIEPRYSFMERIDPEGIADEPPPAKFAYDPTDRDSDETEDEARTRQEEDHAERVAKYEPIKKAIDEHYAELGKTAQAKIDEARERLERLKDRQEAHIRQASTLSKEQAAALKASEAERRKAKVVEDDEDDALVNAKAFADEDTDPDDGEFTDPKVAASYDAAVKASREMIAEDTEARGREPIDLGVDDLRESLRATKSALKAISRIEKRIKARK